tara:strand:- start:288 stop:434 length:147 start_codon:yes stop_codon:yes gene_type:complete
MEATTTTRENMEHQDFDFIVGSDLDPLNDDSDWTDPGVPGDFDFTVGG